MAHPRSTITLAAVIASIVASCGAPANVTPSPDSPAGDEDGSVTVVDTSYAGDPDPALQNPERGMYFGGMPGAGEFHTIVPEWLWLDTVCGQNLTWNGHNQPGTSAILDTYADKLETYRTNGVKVLFRPRYDRPSDVLRSKHPPQLHPGARAAGLDGRPEDPIAQASQSSHHEQQP